MLPLALLPSNLLLPPSLLLASAPQTQRALQEKAEASYHRAAARLRELQTSYQEGSAGKLLETLNEDVKNLRAQVRRRAGIVLGSFASQRGFSAACRPHKRVGTLN